MRNFKPAALYFALVMGAGFVLDMIRVPFLVPRLGERHAELLAMALQGRTLAQFIASRDPVSGPVYLVMLLLFALMPAILARRGRRP